MKRGAGYLKPETIAKAIEAWVICGMDIRKAAMKSGLSVPTVRKSVTMYRSEKHNGLTLKSKIC